MPTHEKKYRNAADSPEKSVDSLSEDVNSITKIKFSLQSAEEMQRELLSALDTGGTEGTS